MIARKKFAPASSKLVLVISLALLAACGTRVSDTDVIGAASRGATVVGAPTSNEQDGLAAPATAGQGTTGPAASETTGGAAQTSVAGPGHAPVANGGGAASPDSAGSAAATPPAGKAATGGAAASSSKAAGSGATSASAGAPAIITKSAPSTAATGAGATGAGKCATIGTPIIIGQTGAFSGLVGQSTGNIRIGLEAGVKWLNDNGGIACHSVILYQKDDGSDPSKAAANVDDLVKNKHAIALVGINEEIVMAAAASEARRLGVPIVGGDQVAPEWYTDANVFPIGGSAVPVFGGPLTAAAKDTKFTKFGLLYCVEASACGTINDNFQKMSAPSKGEVVFKQAVSLTQTDFTSACQGAKSAGVEILYLSIDASSVQRAARNCKSIGYTPTLATVSIATAPSVVNDPNVRADSLYIGAPHAPYVGSGTPEFDRMHAAFKRYTGRDIADQPMMYGWVDAQFFAAALNSLGAPAKQGSVTTATVLQGLYNLKGETLGGLIPPMTFTKGKPAPFVDCYTALLISDRGVSSPTGNKPVCNS